MLYFLGKSCNAFHSFVQPAFFLVGNSASSFLAIVVAFKNLFTLGNCFQVFAAERPKGASSNIIRI